ncbi:hypothetical protein [Anaerotignum sp.]|uniref:hypothetical protein n=1 Tax=Anaerotignum sp. TaxID=2039241 RepID=UPI0028A1238F|nr:hypothetical protein [Anaerotignum sp.]
MIDLSKVSQDSYKIKLPNKDVLKIKKPTQAMFKTMNEMVESDMEEIEIIETLYRLMLRIFNRNLNGIEFTEDEISEIMDIRAAMEVLKDYLQFSVGQLGE